MVSMLVAVQQLQRVDETQHHQVDRGLPVAPIEQPPIDLVEFDKIDVLVPVAVVVPAVPDAEDLDRRRVVGELGRRRIPLARCRGQTTDEGGCDQGDPNELPANSLSLHLALPGLIQITLVHQGVPSNADPQTQAATRRRD